MKRTIRLMPSTPADKKATRLAHNRAYNSKYYREVRLPKIRAERRQRVAGEVIDWLSAQIKPTGSWGDEIIAEARRKFL